MNDTSRPAVEALAEMLKDCEVGPFGKADEIADMLLALLDRAEIAEARRSKEEADWVFICTDWRERNEKLEARAEKAEKEREWRPIETAPRDGTKISLLYPYPRGHITDCFWMADLEMGWARREPRWEQGELLHETEWVISTFPNMEPTHWMPLPSPPALYEADVWRKAWDAAPDLLES